MQEFTFREMNPGDMKNSYVIGIDIGGTNFRIGAVDSENQVSNFQKIKTTTVFRTEDVMGDLTAYLKKYCQLMEAEGKNVNAVVIGFPATINKERTKVLQAPNVAFMENMPVVEVLSQELKVPVYIERDVSSALIYDCRMHQLDDCEIIVGCYFGTGLGNAIMINGQMLVGKNGTAGELGHIPVDGSDWKCGCGNEGCMENLAAGKYLTYLCDEVYPDATVENIFIKYGNEPLLKQFVDRMAMAVATEINILDPDCVVIGGGVPNMKGFLKEYLVERILARARKPYPANNLRLIFAEDAEDKCVIGSAMYAHLCMEN